MRKTKRPSLVGAIVALMSVAGCHPPQAAVEAEALLLKGDLTAAERRVADGLAGQPDNGDLWRLKIRIALERNQIGQAVASYRERARRGEDKALLRHLALSVIRWGMKHRDPVVRLAAVQAARETDDAALEDEMGARLGDPDEVIRTWAALALSEHRDGVDVLERQLRSSNPRARAIAVRAVGKFGGAAAVGPLARFVDDGDASVRSAAADALAVTRRREALEPLRRLLADRDPWVRADAARAISSLGLAEGAAVLRGAAADAVPGVRLAVAVALCDLKDEGAKATLAALAAGDDLTVALRAALRLSRLGDAQPALNAIAKALVDRRWPVRAAGCNAASSVKSAVVVALLQRALKDPVPAVQMAAARATFSRGAQESAAATARAIFATACRTRGPASVEMCLEAAELLARAGQEDGRSTLAHLARLASPPERRLEALRAALIFVGRLTLAIDALPDPDPRVSIAAAAWIYRRTK
jgi:HEAT repeat protein